MPEHGDDDQSPALKEKSNVIDPNQIELFKEFLKVQAEEIELKRQGFEIEIQSNKDSHEYAKLALQAQVRDREAERLHRYSHGTRTYWFIGGVIILLLLFAGFALYIDKEAVVKQLGEMIVVVLGAASGGY